MRVLVRACKMLENLKSKVIDCELPVFYYKRERREWLLQVRLWIRGQFIKQSKIHYKELQVTFVKL